MVKLIKSDPFRGDMVSLQERKVLEDIADMLQKAQTHLARGGRPFNLLEGQERYEIDERGIGRYWTEKGQNGPSTREESINTDKFLDWLGSQPTAAQLEVYSNVQRYIQTLPKAERWDYQDSLDF